LNNHPYWLPLYENGPAMMVNRIGKSYRIEVRQSRESNDVIWCDTQRIPFWASDKRRGEILKIFSKLFPLMTKENFAKVCMDMASAESFGDIPTPTKPPEEEQLSDKQITDTIIASQKFYCDITDPNTILYVWRGGEWCNGIAEGLVLNELTKIFDLEDDRSRMLFDKTVNFIKGRAMENVVLPKPSYLVSFKNGVLNVKTLAFERQHDCGIFYLNQIPHDYNPSTECPNWIRWLGEVIQKEDIPFLQEWTGYQLYDSYPEPAFLVLTGTGQNGKSVYMDMLIEILGHKNISNISLVKLTYDAYAPAELYHRLANISDEIKHGVIGDAGVLKEAASGSYIHARQIYGKGFDFKPYAKITYACNEPPEIKDQSEAIKFRLKVVEFPYTFTKEPIGDQKAARERQEIMDELRTEIPGIVNWAMDGLRRLMKNKFKFSRSKSTEETWLFYQRRSNPVVCFIEECLEMTDDDTDWVSREGLWAAFKAWIEASKIKIKVSRNKFWRDLKEQGIEATRSRDHDMKRVYLGMKCSSVPIQPTIVLSTENNNIREDVNIVKYMGKREASESGTVEQTISPKEVKPIQVDVGIVEQTPIEKALKILSDLRKEGTTVKLVRYLALAADAGVPESTARAVLDDLETRGKITVMSDELFEVV